MIAKSALAPLLQESTPSLVARQVREAIATGEFAPGSQVSEAALAAQLGVSRGPLREGLQRLTAEGLLIGIRNRGLFVIEMTPENVVDMYIAREAVERAAARRIHERDPRAAGESLLEICVRMAQAAAAQQPEAVGAADIAFHETLVGASASPRLIRMNETLLTETRLCIQALEATYASGEVRVEEHTAIARSFVAGDAARTDQLLIEHMRDAVRRLCTSD
ncbi:DNA-binding GntR family transcriptional regulator [Kineosphaera limosa]|uniref:Putative GntR family transcriptional regulator n=1 Tax=Kineosphaera limosa NBRC 100340 TaxID=1184609 RepID=K6XH73_9MICO|nr:GntR family transcriptional regulator [Kineosphaera limosa]NYE00132.1 DNA-binding GntR family transcriptional regulator [Kineosphaera limosa]GAB98189.1 putative GntR family transcriptional regulator [Kineosphaera limosa NBRC 100340]